jgi:hypothetical protein
MCETCGCGDPNSNFRIIKEEDITGEDHVHMITVIPMSIHMITVIPMSIHMITVIPTSIHMIITGKLLLNRIYYTKTICLPRGTAVFSRQRTFWHLIL